MSSSTSKTALNFGQGVLTFVGLTPDGEPVKFVFHNVKAMGSEAVVVEREEPEGIGFSEIAKVWVTEQPETWLVLNLRMLNEEGTGKMMTFHQKPNAWADTSEEA